MSDASDLHRSLHPAARRRLPVELRPAGVSATAEALARGIRDPDFEQLLERIDGGPLVPALRIVPFFDGDVAMSAMRQAIASARSEVLIEAYIFADDDTGQSFAEALGEAARRGVSTRVLADAFGSFQTRATFWSELERQGVVVRHFHPLLSRIFWHPFRDHRKLLVVDREIAFIGGMNIAEEYARRRKPAATPADSELVMRDTHLLAEGPVARSLAAVFEEGWRRARGAALPSQLDGDARKSCETDSEEPSLLVIDSRPGRGLRERAAIFAAVLGAARDFVWLTVGYFAPDRDAMVHLERAAARGCDVRLLLPGPTDVPVVRHAGHARYQRLLDAGLRIWEYTPSVLHAKSMVVDGYLSVVGSANLDVRSWRLNAECGLLALDASLASSLSKAFLVDLESSEEIDATAWRRRGRLHRLGDRLAGLLTPFL